MKYLFTIINFLLSIPIAFSQTPCEKPVITRQPMDSTACAGTIGSFNITIASATPVTFAWKKSPSELAIGTISSTNTKSRLSISPLKTDDEGTYFVEVTNSCGTTISRDVKLNVYSYVVPVLALFANTSVVCENTPVQITAFASGAGTAPLYKFNSDLEDAGNYQISSEYNSPPLPAGQHEFIVELSFNTSCPHPSVQNPLSRSVIVLAEKMPSTSNAGTDVIICSDTYQLNASPPVSGTGKWTIKSGTATISDSSNPNAVVTGFSTSSEFEAEWTVSSFHKTCPSNSSSVKITRVSDITSPSPVMAQSRTIKFNDPAPLLTGVVLKVGEYSQWTSIGSANITGFGQTSNLKFGHNLFNYTITSAIPTCPPSTATVDITVESPLGLELSDINSEVNIYPNPFKNDLTIELLQNESAKVKIYDSNGTLKDEKAIEVESKIALGNDYPAGLYSIVLSTRTKSSTYRVVKQ